jgi:hypothetical protein
MSHVAAGRLAASVADRPGRPLLLLVGSLWLPSKALVVFRGRWSDIALEADSSGRKARAKSQRSLLSKRISTFVLDAADLIPDIRSKSRTARCSCCANSQRRLSDLRRDFSFRPEV